jgi:hypothetical protein
MTLFGGANPARLDANLHDLGVAPQTGAILIEVVFYS